MKRSFFCYFSHSVKIVHARRDLHQPRVIDEPPKWLLTPLYVVIFITGPWWENAYSSILLCHAEFYWQNYFIKCEEISDKVRKKWRKIWKRLYRPFRPIKWSSDILVLYFVFINVGYTNQDQNNTEKVRTKVNDTADISPAPRPRKLTFIRSWSLWMNYHFQTWEKMTLTPLSRFHKIKFIYAVNDFRKYVDSCLNLNFTQNQTNLNKQFTSISSTENLQNRHCKNIIFKQPHDACAEKAVSLYTLMGKCYALLSVQEVFDILSYLFTNRARKKVMLYLHHPTLAIFDYQFFSTGQVKIWSFQSWSIFWKSYCLRHGFDSG